MDGRLELLVSMVRFKMKTKLLSLSNIISKESFDSWVSFSNSALIYSRLCLLASELTSAAIILQFWTPSLVPWQWAIIIIVPIFALQLIHVRAYGANSLPSPRSCCL